MKNNDISYRSSRGRCAVEVAVGLMYDPDAVVEGVGAGLERPPIRNLR